MVSVFVGTGVAPAVDRAGEASLPVGEGGRDTLPGSASLGVSSSLVRSRTLLLTALEVPGVWVGRSLDEGPVNMIRSALPMALFPRPEFALPPSGRTAPRRAPPFPPGANIALKAASPVPPSSIEGRPIGRIIRAGGANRRGACETRITSEGSEGKEMQDVELTRCGLEGFRRGLCGSWVDTMGFDGEEGPEKDDTGKILCDTDRP